jgi:hypothetical protein
MCDGCGCDKAKPDASGRPAWRVHHKDGWHIHADGTVHKHDHEHSPQHDYTPSHASQALTNKQEE